MYQEIPLTAISLTKKKMKIFGVNMIKGIRNKEFNFYLERCHAQLKSYPGVTAKELKHNIQFPIQMDTPDIVVIHGGCNDVTPDKIKERLRKKKLQRKLLVLAHVVEIKV